MPARLLAAAALVLAAGRVLAQPADPNLQNLLSSLTTGNEATLVTPLESGMRQVTSFRPGTQLNAVDAVAAVDRARAQLQALGEPRPSAEEIARMLAGGPIEIPSGRIHAAGILPASGYAASIRSQVVAAGTPLPPTMAAPAYAAPSAAGGGSSPASPVQARELALQQLASLGILNPSEEQVRTALVGGTLTTINGQYQLPGILAR
jgi:hypothetical protein